MSVLWPTIGGINALSIIHSALLGCPDDRPIASAAELLFVDDIELRENIRLDLSAVERGIRDGSWKSATVLAAASAEVLLLWVLRRCDPDEFRKATNRDLVAVEGLTLGLLVEAAVALKIVTDETAKALHLARDYRNLIHPGREARLKTRCDRGTAHGAFSSVLRLISDIESVN